MRLLRLRPAAGPRTSGHGRRGSRRDADRHDGAEGAREPGSGSWVSTSPSRPADRAACPRRAAGSPAQARRALGTGCWRTSGTSVDGRHGDDDADVHRRSTGVPAAGFCSTIARPAARRSGGPGRTSSVRPAVVSAVLACLTFADQVRRRRASAGRPRSSPAPRAALDPGARRGSLRQDRALRARRSPLGRHASTRPRALSAGSRRERAPDQLRHRDARGDRDGRASSSWSGRPRSRRGRLREHDADGPRGLPRPDGRVGTPAAASVVRASASVRPRTFGTPARTTSATALPAPRPARRRGSWRARPWAARLDVAVVLPSVSPMSEDHLRAASSAKPARSGTATRRGRGERDAHGRRASRRGPRPAPGRPPCPVRRRTAAA